MFTLAAAPNGNLIVGGNFTNVNGAPNTAGLAELDPTSGAVVSGFTAFVTSPRFGAARPFVRSVAVARQLAVRGRRLQPPHRRTDAHDRRAAGRRPRRLSDGTPDAHVEGAGRPTPVDVFPSPDGTRVYIAGFFHNVDNTPGIDAVAVRRHDTVRSYPA